MTTSSTVNHQLLQQLEQMIRKMNKRIFLIHKSLIERLKIIKE